MISDLIVLAALAFHGDPVTTRHGPLRLCVRSHQAVRVEGWPSLPEHTAVTERARAPPHTPECAAHRERSEEVTNTLHGPGREAEASACPDRHNTTAGSNPAAHGTRRPEVSGRPPLCTPLRRVRRP